MPNCPRSSRDTVLTLHALIDMEHALCNVRATVYHADVLCPRARDGGGSAGTGPTDGA